MTCPSFEYLLVFYLYAAVSTVLLVTLNVRSAVLLDNTVNIIQVAQMTLSLIINIYATSIIALKAWCVSIHGIFGKHFVDRTLINDTMCA
jgi:hypothetical protein